MYRKQLLAGTIASVSIVTMILDGKTALFNAQTGVELCFRTVIPSLFPFLFLSCMLTGSLSGIPLRFLRPVTRAFGIPEGAEFVLLNGFLGGYPAGAAAVASGFRDGTLTKSEAESMLRFCSNAGPAFLFGMIGPLFSTAAAPFSLWVIHIASSFLVSRISPQHNICAERRQSNSGISVTAAMYRAISISSVICGWVILFRVLTGFLEHWFLWLLPTEIQVIITGILELSNGCIALSNIQEEPLRYILCSGMLSFGGLCVALQTQSVIQELPLLPYLKGKLFQTGFSILLSTAYILKMWLSTAGILLIFLLLTQKSQNKSGNSVKIGV